MNEVMTEDEKMSKYCEMMQLLSQNDYTARKVVFELAKAFKQAHPDIELPEYEKYKEKEEQAQEFRDVIGSLNL